MGLLIGHVKRRVAAEGAASRLWWLEDAARALLRVVNENGKGCRSSSVRL